MEQCNFLKRWGGILVSLVILSSCDSNKERVETIANQFVSAINGKDKVTVVDLYPSIKSLEKVTIPSEIKVRQISIEKDDSSQYIATLNENMQKLVFHLEGENSARVVDSYNVLVLDSTSTELGIKTGVPLKHISDMEKIRLLNDSSDFLSFLNITYEEEVSGNIVKEKGNYRTSENFRTCMIVEQIIRNKGNVPIKGSEYNVEFLLYSQRGLVESRRVVEAGVDLQPGEAHTYWVSDDDFFDSAVEGDLRWDISFVYKNLSPIETMLKFVKFKGDEYDKFLKTPKETYKKAIGGNDYKWLSERKVTESDLAGKSKQELRIMRNAIFARHGYIFNSSDLRKYFSAQSWYKGEKKNVSAELSTIEKQNVEFIKRHE